jgi:hypothetical protein
MNKHDFYKELMSQYTFDEEKIRRNAKRASSASFLMRNSKWMPLATAAAVFMMVFVGNMAINNSRNIGNNNQFHVAPSQTSFVSENERINDATNTEDLITAGNFDNANATMYISFAKPLTYSELEENLPSSVDIIALWSGGFVNAENAQAPDDFFTGAKVSATKDLFPDLRTREAFSFVELDNIVNDSNFQPINTVQRPIETTENDTDIINPDNTTAETPDNNEINLQPPVVTTNIPQNDGTQNEQTPNTETPVTDEPVTPPSVPDEPVIPDGPQTMLEIAVNNGISVDFITENKFILLTRTQVLLYEISTINERAVEQVAQSFDTHNPQITFMDKTSGTLLIIGSDAFGRKTDLFIADGISGELRRLDTSNVTQGQTEIGYAVYNYSNGEIILKAQNASMNMLFAARNEGFGWFFDKLEESENELTILASTDNGFIYAQSSNNGTKIFRFNTIRLTAEEVNIGIEGRITGFERSPGAKNFAVIAEGNTAYIWLASSGTLATNSIEASQIRFHRYSSTIFNDGQGRWYTVQGTQITAISASEADTAKKPEFSATYKLLDISPALVRIDII